MSIRQDGANGTSKHHWLYVTQGNYFEKLLGNSYNKTKVHPTLFVGTHSPETDAYVHQKPHIRIVIGTSFIMILNLK